MAVNFTFTGRLIGKARKGTVRGMLTNVSLSDTPQATTWYDEFGNVVNLQPTDRLQIHTMTASTDQTQDRVLIATCCGLEEFALGLKGDRTVFWNLSSAPLLLPFGANLTVTEGTLIWTPTQLPGLWGWWDAADANTFDLTGNDIDEWRDKSGNARHFTPTTLTGATTTPTRTGDIGGTTAVDFQRDSCLDQAYTLNDIDTSILHILGVITTMSSGSGDTILATRDDSGASWFISQGSTTLLQSGVSSLGPFGSEPDLTVTINEEVMFSTRYDLRIGDPFGTTLVAPTGSIAKTRKNGGAEVVDGITSTTYNPSNDRLGMGANPIDTGISGGWQGEVGEIILVKGDLTDAQRQTAEGYLGWKWGLEDLLPLDHPYRFDGSEFGFPALTTFNTADDELFLTADGEAFIVQDA